VAAETLPALVDIASVLTRAASLVAEALPEERLVALLAREASDAARADMAAVYLAPERMTGPGKRPWRLSGHEGGDAGVLGSLPLSLGTGGAPLAPLFQNGREVRECDLLDGAPAHEPLPPHLPARSFVGCPIRRRDGRAIGALLVGSKRRQAFDDTTMAAIRALAQLLGVGVDNARLAAAQQRERRMAAESAVTLGTVLESIDSGVCVVDLEGTLRLVNKPFQDLFGIAGRPLGLFAHDVFSGASVRFTDFDAFLARMEELQADPSQVDESEWELATDPPRIIQRHSAPMRNVLGEVVGRVEVYTDITESRRLYTQLLSSEKLRAIGEMASGVAHDFNNLLASILGQTELLHVDELPPPTQQAIGTIRQAALDGARIVRNLQGVARPRAETPSTAADLNDTVESTVELTRPRWTGAAVQGHGGIELRLNLVEAGSLPRVAIDAAELREVLINLLFNAADAMPEGGRIEITTRLSRTPNAAEVEVRDTGHGMPESVRARIFEPFYSTKGAKGSGLGLAVAYSIITRHGGAITVESEVGQGTTFLIRLPFAPTAAPRADGDAAPKPAAPLPPRAPAQPSAALKGARILVADDEPGLVAVVRQLMQRSGAEVTVAQGGAAALDQLRQDGARFDVVITDLDMPEVDGWAVASEVKTNHPNTPVVMLTGWAGEIAPEEFAKRGVDVVLAKPCSRADLESTITDLLAPRPTAGLDVLVVDDEAAFAGSLRGLLGLQGHQAIVASSAEEAMHTLREHHFDAIFTDYSLGDATGAQLAERLAQEAERPYVVLITGYATDIDDPTLMTGGIDAVLPKPCRRDDLREVLGRIRKRESRP
jgi:signal transduction histidine kinase/DNA-binding response OmpR family regulator